MTDLSKLDLIAESKSVLFVPEFQSYSLKLLPFAWSLRLS